MATRRTTVIGLGGLLAGGGALLGTGAFDTVEAERSISLKTAPDSDALLGFEILDEDHVRQTDGTIDFDLVARSKTTFAELVNVRNNGTQTVTRLRFEFDVTVDDQPSEDIEDALHIVSGDATIDADRDTNLLGESSAGGADDDELSPGEAILFGIKVDLTDDIHEITGDPEITLTIIADTGSESGSGGGNDGGEGSGGSIDSILLSDGNGNYIDVTVTVSDIGEDVQLRIRSLRPESSNNPNFRDEIVVEGKNGKNTYSVKGSNSGQADRVQVELIGEDGTVLDTRTVGWPQ